MPGKQAASKAPQQAADSSAQSVAPDSSVEASVDNSAVQSQLQQSASPPPQSADQNKQKAREKADMMCGGELSTIARSFDWTGGDSNSVKPQAKQVWLDHFVPAYAAALESGKNPKQAVKAARKECKEPVTAVYQDVAVKLAEARAQAAIGDGAAFRNLDTAATTSKDEYAKASNTRGEIAKRLATSLTGKSAAEMVTLVDAEPGGTREDSTLSCDKPQYSWTFDDGSFVRVKPEGDPNSSEPMFCVEVLKDGITSAQSQDDVAFKIDDQARAVPKGPYDIANPYPDRYRAQLEAFQQVMIEAGHRKTQES